MLKKILSTLSFLAFFLIVNPSSVFAGTDLSVSCPSTGTCSISPAATPLFEEINWLPGSIATQYFHLNNSSGQDGFSAIEIINYRNEVNNLGEIIEVEIRKDSPVGSVIYSGVTLHEFRDDGYFTIDSIANGQTTDYFLILSMPSSAGNEYEASQIIFDLNMGLELAVIPPDSGGGDGGGDDGSVAGASNEVCSDSAPESAPSLSLVSTGTNTVSLSWTAVSPVSHYALVFTRDSDGAAYGSTNIGNVTNYTVTNLSGGDSYTFEVFGVNGCAPGDRSNQIGTGIVAGPFIEGRPQGPTGDVLGETTEETPDPEVAGTTTGTDGDGESGSVLGDAIGSCVDWKLYLPWILLIIQALLILISEYRFRENDNNSRHYLAVGFTIISMVVFYLLRECQCYSSGSWLIWLCKWYWVASLLLTGLVRVFSYAVITESADNKK